MLSVLEDINISSIFVDLEEHMLEQSIMDNHVLLLVKAVARSYVKIRMHHIAKEFNESIVKNDRVRKKLTKLVLFKHQ